MRGVGWLGSSRRRPRRSRFARYRAALAAANDRKEALEKELARRNPATRRGISIRDATIEDLLARLPADVAVVDFLRLDDGDVVERANPFTKADGGGETRHIKSLIARPVYDAFVLRGDHGEKTGTCVSWAPLGAAQPIDEAIALWRERLADEVAARPLGKQPAPAPSKANTATAGLKHPQTFLRTAIWDKLEPHLTGCHTVILLPDAQLHRLPWTALPGRKAGTYLIEDYALGTASYAQQLFGLLSDEPITGQQRLLLAGGIRYDQRQQPAPDGPAKSPAKMALHARAVDLSSDERYWGYLAGAEREADAVRKLWADQQGPVESLSGAAADESRVAQALARARYVHLATHGFFDKSADARHVYPVNPREQSLFQSNLEGYQKGSTLAGRNPLLMTGVVLAGANLEPIKDGQGLPTGDDGILTAEEIVGLDLRNTQLVTLSACETGLGDVAAGEGVFGLQRAFHQAGARSVIASLWKVDDAATQALMVEFYQNLWQKKRGKLAALRAAQLKMIRDYHPTDGTFRGLKLVAPTEPGDKRPERLPPFYWAAFQLSGDWR